MSPPVSGTSLQELGSGWKAAPLDHPLKDTGTAKKLPWTYIGVPDHWQLHPAFRGYEGCMLYRCAFDADAPSGGETLSLLLEGVYYAARIWLNGAFLGSHEGYFLPFELDCTDHIRNGTNELLVEVNSPHEPEENDRRTLGGVWARWDGMDPGINPGGIFKPVNLIRSGPVRIRSLGIEAHPSGDARAIVHLYTREAREVRLEGRVAPLGFEAPGARLGETVRAGEGLSRLELPFRLPEPRLWRTRDRGEQPMYELALRCGETEERVRFGVRSVELRGWHTYVNGERLFLRGINYLPTDAYPALATGDRLRTDADLLAELGLNAVRVHAHVAPGTFYEACDELGILVLQDFPLQWTHRKRVLEPARQQAAGMARLLRNHPSVGIYLAHDEPFYVVPPEKWSPLGLLRTGVEALLPRWALWQRRVLGPAVIGAIEGEDRTRPVIEAAGHPLTTNHLYFGWYYGSFRDLERAVRVFPGLSRLPTEYGAQALPHQESLEEIWPGGTGPDWETLSKKHRLQRGRMERYVRWRGDREAYVRETQDYQARLLQHATELFRRAKYRPTGGAFAFMLNDPAPAVSWSVVDWRRRRKAGFEALRRAMSPVLVCARYPREVYRAGESLDLPLFIVNDLPRPLGPVRWGWSLELDGEEIARGEGEAGVPEDSVISPGEARIRLPSSGHATLRLWLSGLCKAKNAYEFRVTGSRREKRRGP